MAPKRPRGFKTHRPTSLGVPDRNSEEAIELRRGIAEAEAIFHQMVAAGTAQMPPQTKRRQSILYIVKSNPVEQKEDTEDIQWEGFTQEYNDNESAPKPPPEEEDENYNADGEYDATDFMDRGPEFHSYCPCVDKGEKLGYCLAVLNYLKTRYPGAKIILFYDIVCKLLAHLKSQGVDTRPYLALVPMLHAPVHGSICQVAFSPKLALGSGLFDGEVIEQEWAELQHHVVPTITESKENDADSIFLMVENGAVARNKVFLPNVRKHIDKILEKLQDFMTTVKNLEYGDFKSYSATVKSNYDIRNSKYKDNLNITKNTSKSEALIDMLKSKAPPAEDEGVEIWSKLCALAVEYTAVKIASKRTRGSTKEVGKLSKRVGELITEIKALLKQFNDLPDANEDHLYSDNEEQPKRSDGQETSAIGNESVLETKTLLVETIEGLGIREKLVFKKV
ncbi:hypothetical protein HDU79_008730 [Rhizoclosmatium sp. JEL0117]|nr:hypothetical protein HDU79_008730 [Rhizoclosmatium sp. JEL0117]